MEIYVEHLLCVLDLQRRQEELRRFEEQAQMEVNRRLEIRY